MLELLNLIEQVNQKMKLLEKRASNTFSLGYYLDRIRKISASKLNSKPIEKLIISTLTPITKIISYIKQEDWMYYQLVSKVPVDI